ncbi:MAG: EAL domain-containing protein [Thiomicrorhabdus chilensis]|uniref:EAL and HDOD domain-containing protein n=1 Tax=Thiomicrorhabdus chilensis TaxID=63656 RepID=UPI00299DA0DE|nr:EAL domain-containing protein [Thiomicrorhabdus chilensis]MDX1347158.1 EAL domain-containing protein [Thiomicrorhabdus chilensis]
MSHSDIFVGRQPIFDKNSQLVAYELLFRGDASQNQANFECADTATETVIYNAMLGIGLDELVGPHQAYVNFPENFFHAEVDPAFSPQYIVIEVLEDVRPTPEVIEGLSQLKDLGFQIALDDFIFKKEYVPFLKLADVIKLEMHKVPLEKIPLLFSKIKKITQATLLAEKVETREIYKACLNSGCDLFQGYFFAKPEIVEGKKVSVAKLNLLDLLQKIADPQIALNELQLVVERDVGLSHKLLKMAYQYRTRSMPEFDTIKEVMMLFGLKRVQSWTTMLSMAAVNDVVPEVFVMALTRAIFMREIALKERLPAEESYYLAGLFSLLDVIMGQPLEKVLNQLPLSRSIVDGILEEEGDYGRLLNMAKGFEQSKMQKHRSDYGTFYLQAFNDARKVFKG